MVEKVQGSINDYNAVIIELKEACEKFTKVTQTGVDKPLNIIKIQATYPFKRGTLQKLNIDIGEIRDNFSFMLGVV